MNEKNKTKSYRRQDREPKWFVFDAAGKTLGRFASEMAKILRGKHRPEFTPHEDCGDGVVIVNAEKIVVTGNKEAQKVYRYYTGHIGGLREIPYRDMKARKPDYILRQAIEKMLPRTKLARKQKKRLRIFAGKDHKMTSQKPLQVNI